eukprot:gene23540-31895_t
MAIGDPTVFAQELSSKVEAAIEEELNRQDGVNTVRNDRQPLMKAHLDLLTYSARQEFIKRNFTGSLLLYNRCIDYNPADGRAWLGIARIYWKIGGSRRAALAEKAYKDGLTYNPKNPYLLQAYAVMLIKLGQVKEAQKLLIVSVKSNPSHAASWCSLADINFRNGDIGTARFCYTSAVENDPRSYVALQAWGQLESNKRWGGDVSKARSLFRQAVDVSGNDSVHSYHAWALLERREGNLEESQRLLNIAMERFPQSTRIRLSLAELQELRGGRTKESVQIIREIFRDGIDIAAAIGDAGFVQSWAMFEQRVLAQIDWIRKKSEVRVNTSSTTMDEADGSLGGPDEFDDQELAFVTSTVDEPQDEAATTGDQHLQQLIVIRRLFNRAIAINKYHSASWIGWAKFEQKYGNADVARKLLITGISNFPTSKNIAWFHSALGSVYLQQAKDSNTTTSSGLSQARACYQRALTSSPPQQSFPIIMALIRIETSYGSQKGVAKLLQLAEKRFPDDQRLSELRKVAVQQPDAAAALLST